MSEQHEEAYDDEFDEDPAADEVYETAGTPAPGAATEALSGFPPVLTVAVAPAPAPAAPISASEPAKTVRLPPATAPLTPAEPVRMESPRNQSKGALKVSQTPRPPDGQAPLSRRPTGRGSAKDDSNTEANPKGATASGEGDSEVGAAAASPPKETSVVTEIKIQVRS